MGEEAMSDHKALIERLRDVAQAYPDDIFPEFTDTERKEHSALISRASGCMGRFLSKHLTAAADAIEALVRERDAIALRLQIHAGDITSAQLEADREHEERVEAMRERDDAFRLAEEYWKQLTTLDRARVKAVNERDEALDALRRLAALDEFKHGEPTCVEEVMNYVQYIARAILAKHEVKP
jgi:hypothetical protein